MRHLIENAAVFQTTAKRVLSEMFGLETTETTEVVESVAVKTSKSFIVSIYYTGTVYGEYMLAMDEETAAKILGIGEPITDLNRSEIQEQFCDAFSEILNMVVGECIVHLQATYAKLTLTPPRVFFGKIRYPNFRTGRSVLHTPEGEIECHFCLDLMRLDLATSYNDALASLLDVNSKLKQANEHLAQQQAQLVHSEKMASVGMLASGVAHEINNPLFFVESNLTTLNDYITIIESMISLYENLCVSVNSPDLDMLSALAAVRAESEGKDLDFVLEDTQHLVAETREGVSRIKSIVKSLKEFSHVDVGGVTDADLNLIVENSIALISHELTERCELVVDCQNLPKIVCHAGEIGQVLIHMLVNASHAIQDSGQIRVRSYAEDSEVFLIIEDSGQGIDPSDLSHIFDPFFTTKPVGKGVGLGLSISYGIIRKHNGSISVESEVGRGTKFTIRLPVTNNTLACIPSSTVAV
jgi:two-component system, NtrC family, sensor kinase